MIDLSDILQPVDISIDPKNGGYVIVKCRDSLYEQIKKELTDTCQIYGIEIVYLSEEVAKFTDSSRKDTLIQLVAWKAKIDSVVLANRIAEYYRKQSLNAVVL